MRNIGSMWAGIAVSLFVHCDWLQFVVVHSVLFAALRQGGSAAAGNFSHGVVHRQEVSARAGARSSRAVRVGRQDVSLTQAGIGVV